MTTSGAVAAITKETVTERAAELLAVLAGPTAVLRPAQLAAIQAVVVDRRRAFVVQRTGFGKSAVYFIATKLLRDAGAGPTLVVSPLLALMRDQVIAAERMGVRSATINSTNPDDWHQIEAQIAAGEIDLLCISPERLNHFRFAREVLPSIAAGLGLLVIDEAHCISDWGHDFRPDYRRIRDAIANLDPSTPVIATTATANERVIADVAEQLGTDVTVLRGTLDRESLALGVTRLDSTAERLAWVAQRIPQVEGTGIVYCLTVDQTEQVAAFLRLQGIDAAAYSGRTPNDERLPLEDAFKQNQIKVLVATSALGMGVDKPDVTFVYHLGAPPSPIAYYQQVGRAGRSVPHAEGWLLPGPEDQAIWDWFTSVGLPSQALVQRVLDQLSEVPITLPTLERNVDLQRSRLETLLKVLDVDGAVERTAEGFMLTGTPWVYDRERVERVRQARADEADQMLRYAEGGRCLMEALRSALDDPGAAPCGRCEVCTGSGDPVTLDPAVVRAAVEFLRGADVVIEPRKQWAKTADDVATPTGNVAPGSRAEEGRALCRVEDSGWWPLLRACERAGEADDELMAGVFAALKRWPWAARPTWVTWVPSSPAPSGPGPSGTLGEAGALGEAGSSGAQGGLAAQVAERIGAAGKLPVHPTLADIPPNFGGSGPDAGLSLHGSSGTPGSGGGNSAFRLARTWRSIALGGPLPDEPGPVLVVSDRCDSRWTQTVVAHLLREAGSGPVLPFALARV